ncbi:class I SAM-dependent methyltransferase [Marinomonas algicola]|uniref:class I SAM-dependent methyltransferase n=1 Tax=Marinomonas algicola TaxID=2773454 RepID=UPI00174B677B|nr:class I SAM-dependent methyltransferase [Marinomonas algicola]
MSDKSVSSTAFTVLQGLVYMGLYSDHKYLVSEETCLNAQKIMSMSEVGSKRLAQCKSVFYHKIANIQEWALLPGIRLHYALRKRKIEQITKQAIDNGCTQVINLGAGFDCLLWQLHDKYKQVNFIEVDHPTTSKYKKAALENDVDTDNFHFLEVDFSHQILQEELKRYSAFNPNLKTLFIAEGVLMYLSESDIRSLFSSMSKLIQQECTFCFTCLEPVQSEKNNTPWLLQLYLRMIGEPLQCVVDSKEMSGFLSEVNAELLSISDTNDMVAEFIQKPLNQALHHGEYVVLSKILN